jgi:hypothetical protein
MSEYDLDESVPSWDKWLVEFEADVMPMFLKHGYTRDTALLAYQLNAMYNRLPEKDDDDDEDWKGR